METGPSSATPADRSITCCHSSGPRALAVAREAVAGGADWVEAGTPLIKAEGLTAVRALKAEFPDKTIVADMKTMDAGRVEVCPGETST